MARMQECKNAGSIGLQISVYENAVLKKEKEIIRL